MRKIIGFDSLGISMSGELCLGLRGGSRVTIHSGQVTGEILSIAWNTVEWMKIDWYCSLIQGAPVVLTVLSGYAQFPMP